MLSTGLTAVVLFGGAPGNFFGPPAASAASADVVAQGRELFKKKEGLGAKFACILCHKKKKAIKRSVVEKLDDAALAKVINKQSVAKSKGAKGIAEDGEQMQALIAYIRQEHITKG